MRVKQVLAILLSTGFLALYSLAIHQSGYVKGAKEVFKTSNYECVIQIKE